ncbi:Protein SHQ1 [Pichia kudriavzevii]|uniref:Protein SHQ1 n=1 Tax=Pichia kudriavzevii TaxID=4909 RepID=A0A1V2LMS2_PICKU|nr:Protein SHQ1 [Pichia kudriavzevii]
MLTPRFELNQDEEFVYIKIHISNIRFSAAAIEMVVNENVFVFSLPPYYLRLRFPKQLVENEDATSEFVPNEECIKVRVPKLNKGEFFPDLDLGAKLLARLNEPSNPCEKSELKGGLIEEVDIEGSKDAFQRSRSELEREALTYDWEVPQTMPDPLTDLKVSVKYGFNNQYSDYLTPSLANGNDINELSDPDHLQPDDRIMERLIKENIKFDMEYYANDYITVRYLSEQEGDVNGIIGALTYASPYWKLFNDSKSKSTVQVEFTQEEQDRMTDLPRKTYLVDDPRPLYYTLLCLLFSYSYEVRSFQGETTIESAWSIGKLTPQISCLDSQLIQSNNQTEKNMIRVITLTMARRALGYPLFRHFDLVKKSWMDVYWTLRCGKRAVLKSLLAIRELFRKHDIYYVYCKILLDDLCAWVLRDDGCNDVVLRNLAHALRKEIDVLDKKDVVFEKLISTNTEEIPNDAQIEMDVEKEDQFEFLNLVEVEELADEAYESSL